MTDIYQDKEISESYSAYRQAVDKMIRLGWVLFLLAVFLLILYLVSVSEIVDHILTYFINLF